MNLIEQSEQLKMLPDQALVQMQQQPREIPPWLVVQEMSRRQKMRESYQKQAQSQSQGNPMQQPSVSQQVQERFQQMNPPQGFAGGGLASLPQLGQLTATPTFAPDPMIAEYQVPSYPKPRSVEEILGGLRDLYKDNRLSEEIGRTTEMEESYRNKKPKISELMMQAGLAMAASRRPDLMGMIGEGGLSALGTFMQDRNRNQAMADKYSDRRIGLQEALQRSDDALKRDATVLARGEQAGVNTNISAWENARLARLRAVREAEDRALREMGLTERNKADITSREAIAEANAKAKSDESKTGHSYKMEEIREQNKRPRGTGRAAAQRESPDEKDLRQRKKSIADRYRSLAVKLMELETDPKVAAKKAREQMEAIEGKAAIDEVLGKDQLAEEELGAASVAAAARKAGGGKSAPVKEFIHPSLQQQAAPQQGSRGGLGAIMDFFNKPRQAPSAPAPWNR